MTTIMPEDLADEYFQADGRRWTGAVNRLSEGGSVGDLRQQQPAIKDLGDGLIMRRGTRGDAEALRDFNAHVHQEGAAEPAWPIGIWTHDLLTKGHPTVTPDLFTIVEDTSARKIVSSLCLIPQTFTYDGVPFEVGQPELVGTLPDYRNRGLVREQMGVVHEWSTEREHLAQVIGGIPYFYRQFGYEMCLESGGRRTGSLANVEKRIGKGGSEGIYVRRAEETDIPRILELYSQGTKRWLIGCARNVEILRYELFLTDQGSEGYRMAHVIRRGSDVIGHVICRGRLQDGYLQVNQLELRNGESWLDVAPTVLVHLKALAEELANKAKTAAPMIALHLGSEHPFYRAAASAFPHVQPPNYAWYVRVPDVSAFLRRIAPVSEERLAESDAAGFIGDLKLSFYREGIRAAFDNGKVKSVEPWHNPDRTADASFPDLTFLQLLFGYRSMDELVAWYPDCRVNSDAGQFVLPVIFPKKPSHLMPLG